MVDLQAPVVPAETDADQVMPLSEVPSSPTECAERGPYTCDLCEVEYISLQELEDHLENRSHWVTLEHIQQHGNYDDLAVAFLQEVMLYKGRQCNQAMEETAIQALQDKDFITKVEMLHCAPCKVYFCTSAHSVQNHLSSPQHLLNRKMFRWRQRQSCLAKAETMIQELRPQYEQFLQGDSPFQ
ncbi:DBIRD complex subunit ZNF326 [Aplochiton taeniatus]